MASKPKTVKSLSDLKNLVTTPKDNNTQPVVEQNIETLDIAIWDFMADHKPRTATEIDVHVIGLGFNKVMAIGRSTTLIRRGWFDRKERAVNTFYTLKKEIKRPGSDAVKPIDPQTAPTPQVKLEKVGGSMVAALSKPASVKAVTAPTPNDVNSEPTPEVFADDPLILMIWKVMSDYRPYGVADVALLLAEFVPNKTTVSVRISELKRFLDWFEVDDTKKNVFKYTLKRSVLMPTAATITEFHTAKSNARKAGGVAQGSLLDGIVPPPKPVEKLSVILSAAETFVVQPPTQLLVRAPLIEVIVRIKGMDITFREGDEIADVLYFKGYGHGDEMLHKRGSGVISDQIKIKDQVFEPDELELIAQELFKNGFGNRKDD